MKNYAGHNVDVKDPNWFVNIPISGMTVQITKSEVWRITHPGAVMVVRMVTNWGWTVVLSAFILSDVMKIGDWLAYTFFM